MFQKFTDTPPAGATKTHALVDASIVDIMLPQTPLDTSGSLARSAVYAVAGWVGRGYRDNKTIGF